MAGKSISSSTRREIAADTKAFVVLPVKNRVCSVTGREVRISDTP
jgi:hypothetical protein